MTLKGHLIDGRTGEPISNAEVYILGGDQEYETKSNGEYRLDLTKGDRVSYGDEVLVYVKHPKLGFHKERITIPRNLRYDISITPNNMIRINGTVLDENSGQPIQGIEVVLTVEESVSEDPTISTVSDKYGGYSFYVSKSIIGGQRYCNMKFVDASGRGYQFRQENLNVRSPQSVRLKKSGSYNHRPQSGSGAATPTTSSRTAVKLSPVGSSGSSYKTVSFNSARGVKRHEFKVSPNSNARSYTIADGDKVKVLRSRMSEGVSWYEVEYNGKIGWIKAQFIQ